MIPALLAGLVVGALFYVQSPKRRVARLWKEIFKYAAEIGKHQDNEYTHSFMKAVYKPKMDRAGQLIDALLLYHFPNTEDDEELEEYVRENTYGEGQGS